MNPSVSKSNHEMVFGALVVLALVTISIPFWHLSGIWGTVLIFVFAFAQAGLVSLQYMGLKIEGIVVYSLVIIPLILFAILVFLCIPDISHYPLHLNV